MPTPHHTTPPVWAGQAGFGHGMGQHREVVGRFSEIVYSFKYFRNLFKLPKFIEIYSNLKKIQI
jgi:hypothetical protein